MNTEKHKKDTRTWNLVVTITFDPNPLLALLHVDESANQFWIILRKSSAFSAMLFDMINKAFTAVFCPNIIDTET